MSLPEDVPPTLGDLLSDLTRRFGRASVPSARVDAELLVMHVLNCTRTELVLRRERCVMSNDRARLEELARRRCGREPLQHLLGEVEWGDLILKVTPAALIPRPETEVLLELALRELSGVRDPRVLDIGTGTGALALGIARARPDAQVWATDLSADALELARENAEHLGLPVTFALGHLHAGLAGPFDLIVSNPPYLPLADAPVVAPEVRRDPELALYAGEDGLAVARPLVHEAQVLVGPQGVLALELDPRNVALLAAEMSAWHVEVQPDLTGRARFLLARR
ncbi:peptide chain release factor N(5)-glutamine methyltransferase [Deinococcus peraridilitoris]|uniref:Release factor glutamine methyltransferase n=1 Tax=Deinococcus peraridilitoris (strain DSM 19664 / LMG 22246 / CIP 109416 / KR-200) TaxID=937777 RepID=L0A3P6_DEIPD|nr:peptide chain release factor N(5)-glutamine methyltransferase [Deinococcus peraridilitoris]AFZ68059.1 protein-(glutamine-N5) methyltransferase, release factor-specific [Deinococcus peraridilitoris DSM 19664]